MDDRMKEIRDQLYENPSERELYIMELEEQIRALEPALVQIKERLCEADRMMLEGYILGIAELEWHTVVQAYRRGKELGIRIGESRSNRDMTW